MKKLITILLLAAMVFALVGCGEGGTPASGNGDVDVVSDSGENGAASDSGNGGENGGASASLGDVKAGDYVTFGSYEQDADFSNGKEDIEWLVLDVQGGSALLISKYALNSLAYNVTSSNVTWETCTLREWANGTFLNEAFSAEEQDAIIETTIKPDENSDEGDSAGSYTTDKVFLINIAEAGRYFDSDEARMCVPTEYAEMSGAFASPAFSSEGRSTCAWWMRTYGKLSTHTDYVNYSGKIDDIFGRSVGMTSIAFRPAIWVRI